MKLVACLSLVCLLTLSPAWSRAGETSSERTLSPYFLVEGGEASGEQFPLLATKVEAAISGVIAKVSVRQQYTYRGAQPIHARYIFPGSTRAAVHGLKMIIGERIITAQIKEKEAARQIFEAAKKEGKNASLLEQQRQGVITRQLAAWAAILAVPTAIAGIYGMNFEHMPELGWTFGYPLAIALMGSICGLLYWRFRAIGWL